jgi:hypothetical protein
VHGRILWGSKICTRVKINLNLAIPTARGSKYLRLESHFSFRIDFEKCFRTIFFSSAAVEWHKFRNEYSWNSNNCHAIIHLHFPLVFFTNFHSHTSQRKKYFNLRAIYHRRFIELIKTLDLQITSEFNFLPFWYGQHETYGGIAVLISKLFVVSEVKLVFVATKLWFRNLWSKKFALWLWICHWTHSRTTIEFWTLNIELVSIDFTRSSDNQDETKKILKNFLLNWISFRTLVSPIVIS